MKKCYTAFIAMIIIIASLSGCSETPVETTQDDTQPTVVTSFYPIAYLAQEIAGDTVEVVNLIPSGAEPHSYEPTVRQMALIEDADLFIFQGAGLEPWVEAQEESLETQGVQLLEVASHLTLLENEEHEEEHHDEHEGEDEHHDEDEDDHHDHGEFDPHTWLDPMLAMETIDLIEKALADVTPSQSNTFAANADTLRAQFSELDKEFKTALNNCELRTFITSHDAFGYLANRYDLEVVSVTGVSPHDAPSAVQIAELVEHAQEENIQHIFFEVLANSKTAETLASEAGLDVLVLNPIAGLSDDTQNETYVTLMAANLNNLQTGLRCNTQ